MISDTLTVVIDERKRLSELDELPLMQANRKFIAGEIGRKAIFKDYILSSEVFYIDTTN